MIYYAPNKAKCLKHDKTKRAKTMTQLTENAVKAVLTADSTVDMKDLNAAIAVLKGESPLNVIPTDEGDAVINRKQVAVLIGKSLATVDIYGRRGVFRRVYFTNRKGKRKQSQGYSRRSVLDAIKNGAIDGTGAAQGDGE